MVETIFSVSLSACHLTPYTCGLAGTSPHMLESSVLSRYPYNEVALDRTPQSLLLYHTVCIVIYICSTVPLDFDFCNKGIVSYIGCLLDL